MPVVSSEKLASLQRHSSDVRNTSLTDALLATNGIISPKLAGKIRYLDSRPDEQLRGITMESSAISLYFSMLRRNAPDAAPEAKEYLINLIDSPGHIDFSSEVSTASRLCDGAVVLVDVVEGVCSQTVTVLRQTWIEKLKPLLVFNKIDRLITELKMTPNEAYVHLSKLLEQVNAVLGSFFQGERMEEDLNWRERMDERVKAAAEKDLYEKKLGIKRGIMEKVLWGSFYLDPKTKKILGPKHLKGRNLKPMFVQLVLEPIWAVYQATTGGDHGKGDPALLEKITKSLNLTLPPHIMRSRDPRLVQSAVFAAWLPLSTALLVSVIESLPAPPVAQAARLPEMIQESPGGDHVSDDVKDAMVSSKTEKSDPIVAYVSKMVSIPESELPQNKRRAGQLSPEEARELARKKRAEAARAQAAVGGDSAVNDLGTALEEVDLDNYAPKQEEKEEDPEHLIGFARMYSGTLSVGDELYVIPPKWSPANPHSPEPHKITVTALYMLMGRSLEALDSVPAGVVFGIGGLEGHILKSGTLCSRLEGAVNLAGVNTLGKPIVRVALEPVNPADLDKMIHGLRLLVQSDPCAEYEQFSSGEHVLLTAGELHLERCITDLQDRFAHCEIQAGAPIVPYRETIVKAEEMRPPANKDLGRGVVVGVTSSKQVSVKLRIRPLPAKVTDFLSKNSECIKGLYTDRKVENGASEDTQADEADIDTDVAAGKTLSQDEFKEQLQAQLESGKGREAWKNTVERIAAFGPRRTGPNLLIDGSSDGILQHLFASDAADRDVAATAADESLRPAHLADKLTYAFQLAVAQGPLCHEPVQGIVVTVEEVTIHETEEAPTSSARLTGEVLKTTSNAIHSGMLDWSPRLLLAIYTVEIQASTEVLGRVYDVLTRRRGRVLSEAMKEGTPFFTIASVLPVAESFGFADEMRKRTSGAAQPQLIFAGFEILDEDPFWVPFTEDDLEDLGEFGDKENVAKRYMDAIRKKKGLLVEGRNVATDAQKQKTLKR
ncbi:elongation factor 2 [Verticillium alfalfae VaMs.102]|uniref:Ribosome assembly protein 1 n=1 Tax=Verticillium alfalfae (strain VaMs.102 / ATCC MYA-4576 / FGSC 10136) TaxID=526221 RepID=C9SPW3_VERA1|nr:elongation factor 2 [Verticillium alfalfae VaMs.102]EEY20828.1 elongation factor 2 [Verticillium alfalfae VaMs.102]